MPFKWKWVQVRQSGERPPPRSGFSLLPYSPAATGGFERALLFGGVCDDDEEDEETLESVFYNDMHTVDLENGRWYELFLRGEKAVEGEAKKRRRRKKSQSDKKGEVEDGYDESGEENDDLNVEDDLIKKPKMVDDCVEDSDDQISKEETKQIFDDGIFSVSIGVVDENDAGGAAGNATAARQKRIAQSASALVPEERMNAQIVLKNNVAYIYGGMKEDGDKTLTLRDFYSLDMSKLDTWRIIARDDRETKQWAEESESSDDDEEEEEEEEGAAGGDSEGEDDDNAFEEFWGETRSSFIALATKELMESGQSDVTKKMIKKRAFQLAKEEFEK